MRLLASSLSALLVVGGCATQAPTTALVPPYEFPTAGGPVSKLTFQNDAPGRYVYNPVVYEDARACTKPHSVNMAVSRTLLVPAGKEVTFSVGYLGVSMPTVSWCARAMSLVPDGSEYIIRSTFNEQAQTCQWVVGKVVEGKVVPAENVVDRRFKQPFLDGWCAN